ncbi:MAG: glycosyltransferase family 9 protein [Gemmatimonadales bacterium]|nr:glycosyltransferase family 9 protein [Gemmatimonadales bacterium]
MTGNSRASERKILIVRVGRGGDLIMITPAVNALLAAHPEAELHLLTSADGRRIMANYSPRITKTYSYTRRFPRTLLQQRSLLKQFKAERYSSLYIFETKPHYRKWLGNLAQDVHSLEEASAGSHYCNRCLDLVAGSLEAPVIRGWVSLPVTETGRRKARALLKENGVDPEAKLVGLHPTFSGAGLPFFRDRKGNRHRLWPGEHFAKLAGILADVASAKGLKLALVVDALPEEKPYVQSIMDKSGGSITLLAAPPDFQRYKGLLSLLDVLVTPNTGPMHIAAALNTPVVALFSTWSPEDCGPFMDPGRYRVLRAEETVDPGQGLASIEPDQVADTVLDLLQKTSCR